MRQAPQDMGTVQRQVTARTTAGLQAPQQQILIDPNSNRFADALVDFANTAGRAYKQHTDALKDAQAVSADVALDGYNDAMRDILQTRPDILDRPEEFDKLDQEMRQKYFKDVTDPEIMGKVTSRLDSWVDTRKTSYAYAKQEKQRLDTATTFFMNNVKKVEEMHKAGQMDEEQASEQLRTLFGELRNSPSFQLSQGQVESLVTSLQDAFSKDGSHRVLLARTFMNDENLSPELRMALEADLAEGLAMTSQEKTMAQMELYQKFEPMIEAGRLRWSHLEEPVAKGILTPDDARSMLRRQQTRLEKRLKEAQERVQLNAMNPLHMDGPSFKKWEEALRTQYLNQGPAGKLVYYNEMYKFGGTNPVLKAQAERAFSLTSSPVESNDQIPPGFISFMQEASDVWRMGMLNQHIPPEKLADTHAYLYLTQAMGREPYEAYNMLVSSPSAKYSDLDRDNLKDLETEIRSVLGLGEGMYSDLPSVAANVGMKLRKMGGLSQEETVEVVVNAFKNSHIETKYGPVPRANINIGEDALKERLEYSAGKAAEAVGLDKEDLSMYMTPDGRFMFFPKGSDMLSSAASLQFEIMTSDAPTLPDGRQTVQGQRQEEKIESILKTSEQSYPYIPGTAGSALRALGDFWNNL